MPAVILVSLVVAGLAPYWMRADGGIDLVAKLAIFIFGFSAVATIVFALHARGLLISRTSHER